MRPKLVPSRLWPPLVVRGLAQTSVSAAREVRDQTNPFAPRCQGDKYLPFLNAYCICL